MCAIAGIWHFKNKVSLNEIQAFTDSMQHRGPDGASYELFEEDNLALGHRRLSILDLSEAGKQPMTYSNKRYCLTFNGEVYNFIEIKNELISLGYNFFTETDSEVVLAAYEAWGDKCFNKFNGMWAIAIWDSHQKELILCRDRFGVKPLHYCFLENNFFAFASETIAFKHIQNFTRAYNSNNLIRSMHRHNELDSFGETLYENIFQLLPGCILKINNYQKTTKTTWWQTHLHLTQVPKTFDEQKQQFLELLTDACKLRLRSDVPIASALSGGVDSTAVYCMLAHVMKSGNNNRTSKDWQRAFSISFPGSEVDERQYIDSVLKQTNGNGFIFEAKHDDLVNELVHSTKLSDFISGTPISCLTYVYKAMHQHGIVVSMDGHGVDEYLYGYNSSVKSALINSYNDNDVNYSKQLEQTLIDMNFCRDGLAFINSAKQQTVNNKQIFKSIIKKLINKKSNYKLIFNGFNASSLYKPISFNQLDSISALSEMYNTHNFGELQLLKEFNYSDMPYNLRHFDRGSMQNQIEIRMPFMDYRLVTFCMSLPQKSKLNNGYTKYILREALKGIMPEDIRTRKLKIGLGAPTADWFNNGLSQFLPDLISSTKKDISFLNWDLVSNTIITKCKNKNWTYVETQQYWTIINYLLLEL